MQEVAQRLAEALHGYSAHAFPELRKVAGNRVQHALASQAGKRFGHSGISDGFLEHGEKDVVIVARHANEFDSHSQAMLEVKLNAMSDLLRQHKLKLVYSIPQRGKEAVLSIRRFGVTGWLGKRNAFVFQLNALLAGKH